MTVETLGLWLGFAVFMLAMLALDLGVFNRTAHVVSYREAALWSGVWIGLALAFMALLSLWRGPDIALQFLAGYVIEKSLSVNNIFIFVLIVSTFAVPAAYQHRVLFWGAIGALAMRAAVDPGRLSPHRGVPLGALPLRGLLDRDGPPHDPPPGIHRPSRPSSPAAPGPAPGPGDRRV